MLGFIDHIENGDQAVILINDEQKALIIPFKDLPKGSQKGTYLNIKEKGGHYKVMSIDERATKREAEKSLRYVEKLRGKQQKNMSNQDASNSGPNM